MKDIFEHLLDSKGKIKIPDWAKRVKIDVGTSVNAPNSENWLQKNNDLCVFAFEPNPYNIKTISEGQSVWPIHLKKERINHSFFCIETALSDKMNGFMNFYCTEEDGGTSSLFKPTYFKLKDTINVPVINLEYFFNFFNWELIPYIDQIKIDAQSSDFNIIKGMGEYLSERIVYLDVETHTNNQYQNHENPMDIKNYMENHGFECLSWGPNATFLNKKFKNIIHNINYNILGE
jgi:FkbM family methyltransferase